MPEKTRTAGALTALGRWTGRALDLVYPRNCQFCSTPLDESERGVICASCLAQAKRIEAPYCSRCSLPFDGKIDAEFVCSYCTDLKFHFTRAVAACQSVGLVRDCIHRFKYNREMYYLPHLASWLIDASQERIDWSTVDAIVPVPLHPVKQRSREFNQAELLARELSRKFQKPVVKNGIRRAKPTVTQTRLDAHARRENLRNAFAPGRVRMDASRVVLIDDVFTTGATLDSCAKVLLAQGAADIIALTVARGV